MGPHFFKCGKFGSYYPVRYSNRLLQWGRTFSSAEKAEFSVKQNEDGSRFNGAALFQVRKKDKKGIEMASIMALQWGRTFSSAENQRLIINLVSYLTGFNGAALFQVRKTKSLHSFKSGFFSFNGAALFQVRKSYSSQEKPQRV